MSVAKGQKLPKNNRPRSKLQQISCQANWLVHFQMHKIHSCHTSKMVCSQQLQTAIEEYNCLIDEIATYVLRDAEETKQLVRNKDKLDKEQAESR